MSRVKIVEESSGPYFLLENEVQVRIEFKKRNDIGLRTDLLARAIGFKKTIPMTVIDATAGLCRDSFHLVCLGCKVTALEQNEQIYSVVSKHVRFLPSGLSFKLIHADAKEYLRELDDNERPDVIYLDLMFPEKKKSAKSG
jgi:16S rRNA (guanine1516-N2)-methyltransferase